jgi:hypothetical protein
MRRTRRELFMGTPSLLTFFVTEREQQAQDARVDLDAARGFLNAVNC